MASDNISGALLHLQKIAIEKFSGVTDLSASLSLPEWAGGLLREYDKVKPSRCSVEIFCRGIRF